MPKILASVKVPLLGIGLLLVACGGRAPKPSNWDCLQTHTCECRGPEDCPEGVPCINGRCIAPPDAAVTGLGFGERCTADADCQSGQCIRSSSGTYRVCTRPCDATETCPPGWDCKVRPENGEALCVQHLERLCAECSVDDHCHPAFGDYCLTLNGIQGCGRDCNYQDCPTGYVCQTVTVESGNARQCVPEVGSCQCTPASAGLTRSCISSNEYGTCHGEAVCQSNGEWGPCSAAEPAPEVCNGLDDNCDGLIDDDDPGVDVSSLPTVPAYPRCRTGAGGLCEGRWACQEPSPDQWEWICAALDPETEVCNGQDDDCDGDIDEDFRDADGRYVHENHCGSCDLDCETVVEHLERDGQGNVVPGAVACEIRNDSPTCVPQICADGYAPWPEVDPVMCLALVSPQCRPCTHASDCLLAVDQCLPVGDDPHDSCLQGCGATAPYGGCTGQLGVQGCCPDEHLCQDVNGAPLCVPVANSCDCNADRVGVTRPCYLSGAAGAVCVGLQTCQAVANGDYQWTDCDASTTAVEVCDGEDNDCDGVADDPFVDTQGSGTYDVDEHCGACYHDCLTQWSQEIQHAIGGCVYDGPSDTPHCEIVACTTETVGGGGTCQRDGDCPSGWLCHPDYHQCTRSCSAPGDCPGGQCQGGFCTQSCTTNAQCEGAFGAPSTCNGGHCEVVYQFNNIDEVDSNGCECAAATTGGLDEPDLYDVYPEPNWPYVDRNCDGVDGDLANALFVWSDTDSSQGTLQHPYATITEAINAYVPGQNTMILVAAGYYEESLEVTAGVRLYGGYSPDFASRDVVLHPTIVAGPEPDFSHPNHPPGVVNIRNVTSGRTVVAGFVIYGFDVTWQPNPGQRGGTTYAVWIYNSGSSVTLANNVIVAGRGGEGGLGAAGTPGGAGGDGGDGRNSVECNTAQCTGESQAGGAAGSNGSCSASGNPGAACSGSMNPQDYQPPLGRNGAGGDSGSYDCSSNPQWCNYCKYDCVVGQDMDGDDAQSGTDGSNGTGGNGCANPQGSIVSGQWAGGNGAGGGTGSAGVGGGGGGAGGTVPNNNPVSCTEGNHLGDLGATGGGGGAGGCGGNSGGAGGAGGGSFAVFVAYSSTASSRPQIRGNVVVRGEGGSGGAGGYGGHGGLGGQGGTGGISFPPAWCAGYGGKGGRGGDGGSGGGGGGGCGGAAVGVGGNQIGSQSYDTLNTFESPGGSATGGPGGAGGPSPVGGTSDGSRGADGIAEDVHVY